MAHCGEIVSVKSVLKITALKALVVLFFVIMSLSSFAQSIWDIDHLYKAKQSLSDTLYASAYNSLVRNADRMLEMEPLSVMFKDKTPASGDKHDYMSQARYFWPDSTKPDGKPYINLDGISNPELKSLDRPRLGELSDRIVTLSLAWFFSENEKYASEATELIRVWFLNDETRMNPSLNYAQVVPGQNNDKGRCYGLIDTYSFVEMLEGVQLLEKSKSFSPAISLQLKQWFEKYLNWMLTSELGKEEAAQGNNHSVAYDAQVISYAIYTGNVNVYKRFLTEFPSKRIFVQVEPDGRQPNELRRTLAFGYSLYNVKHMIDIFLMGQKVGISIDNATSKDGRNFYKAVDFLANYIGRDVEEWPYEQLSGWGSRQRDLCKDLYRIYVLNPARTDYLKLFQKENPVGNADSFRLLYMRH